MCAVPARSVGDARPLGEWVRFPDCLGEPAGVGKPDRPGCPDADSVGESVGVAVHERACIAVADNLIL